VAHTLPALTLDELSQALGSRARALATLQWLGRVQPLPNALPEAIPNVSRRAWADFKAHHALASPRIAARTQSPDGTTKYALEFAGAQVETVRIPTRGRSTVCISSQAGCSRHCAFCATHTLGLKRQLLAEEMVAQFLVARADAPPSAPARNVVFMGMGEPLDNLEEVLRAVRVLTQAPFPQLKAESVTVSTSGVVPGMVRFLSETRASLALSLNATTDEVRTRLMPQNALWPIAALMDVLQTFHARDPRRATLIEYVLFDGVNDSDADADRLVALLQPIHARVNLIPWNPFPGPGLAPPRPERLAAFHQRVSRAGQRCMVRWPRGQEIAGACGQLVLARDGVGFLGAPLR